MSKPDDIIVKRIIHSIGLNNNLTDKQVKDIVDSQFRFTYEQIRKTSFKNLTNEEIEELKKNFYYKYLGKLYTDVKMVRHKELIAEIYKSKQEDGRKKEFHMGGSSSDE